MFLSLSLYIIYIYIYIHAYSCIIFKCLPPGLRHADADVHAAPLEGVPGHGRPLGGDDNSNNET